MPKISGKLFYIYLFLFVQGFYSQIFQAVLLREMLSRFAGTELVIVALLGPLLLWTAAGCVLGSLCAIKFRLKLESSAAFMLAASVIVAYASYFISAVFPVPSVGSFSLMLFLCVLLPLPFGIVNGIVYGVLSSFHRDGERPGSYSLDAAGAMLGGVLFSLLFADFVEPLRLLCFSGLFVLVSAFAASLLCIARKMFIRSIIAAAVVSAIAALSISLSDGDHFISFLRRGWGFERNIETADGRIEIIRPDAAETAGKSRELYFNGVFIGDCPPDENLPFPNAVFALMQVNKPSQKVLLFCSPFSALPKVFLGIPAVSELTLICQGQQAVLTAVSFGIIPRKREDFRIFIADPVSFIGKSLPEEYDLIYVDAPSPNTFAGNRLYTNEFYSAVSKALKPDGVFAGSFNSSAFFSGTVSSVFRNLAVNSGKDMIIVAGNGKNITSSLARLDGRTGRVLKRFLRFPEGLLSIIYSQRQIDSEMKKLVMSSGQSDINSIEKPYLPFLHFNLTSWISSLPGDAISHGPLLKALHFISESWLILIASMIAVYCCFRFIFSRKMGFRLMFCSFENGFYSMGIVAVLLFVYQCCCGGLYRDLPALLGVFIGGTALGAFVVQRISELARNFLMFFSIMAPVASYGFFEISPSSAAALIFSTLFICGISTGGAFSEFCGRSGASRIPVFWGLEMAGGAVGLCLLMLYLLPSGGFLPCLALLTLSRIHLLAGGKHGRV